ncbi:LytR/AlgR family response regulator transcription factor [Chryseobacterium gregarium]|uniref:LytR/AlgR family response regulator transcription factor n=1 Tax=Chryseobacterium gregarium TaxID=456299 RepID=UPI000404DF2F|nr:LytTR family DNA-binding domain-containing protein [Chryseobacterium gregarium]
MNCIIIDDEPLAHQVIAHYINKMPGLTLDASFRNTVEAFEYLNRKNTDLLFLDIEMPLVNGIHFLKSLADPPATIFTTAHKQYAYDGFELNAVDYLLKPFSYERFVKAVEKAETRQVMTQNHQNNILHVKDGKGIQIINQINITHIEGCGDYVKIFTPNRMFMIYHTLKALREKLDKDVFLQVHRSYIINTSKVISIMPNNLILENQISVPLGQSFKKEAVEKLSE